ncbi:MAG: 2-hydroxyacid dehydrogenase [Gammaproteobacteria bacterium]|nr:MAG: 2-hydroxyacid dehydrogenase [Gammaproteobacteria bacterium]
MKVIFFSTKHYDEECFSSSNEYYCHDLRFVEARLSPDTVSLLAGEPAICVFVNDTLDRQVLSKLSDAGVRLIALRCAGYNNVDIKAARELGLTVVRVPAYSPYAVAEHTVCLMLSLGRKVHRAYYRVRDGNFSLDGLLGFDFCGRTLGIVGSGRIGSVVARIMSAMGMKVLAHDPFHDPDCENIGVSYVDMDHLLAESDVISLHCPLTPETNHLIDESALEKMKKGVMLINTSRGAILDTCAVINGLKTGKIGYLGLDVYEQESEIFFRDLSCEIIQDDVFERLLTFPNVLITTHQGFFTADALKSIADTTLENITQFEEGGDLLNEVPDVS